MAGKNKDAQRALWDFLKKSSSCFDFSDKTKARYAKDFQVCSVMYNLSDTDERRPSDGVTNGDADSVNNVLSYMKSMQNDGFMTDHQGMLSQHPDLFDWDALSKSVEGMSNIWSKMVFIENLLD